MEGTYEAFRDVGGEVTIWPTIHNSCDPHFHSSLELTYVLEGEIKSIVNGKTYYAKKDQLMIFSSYCTHSNTQTVRSKSIVLIVPPEIMNRVRGYVGGRDFKETIVTDPEICEEILGCMKRLIGHKSDGIIDVNIANGYACVIVGLLIGSIGLVERNDEKADYFFKDILRYIEENYATPLSLESIASHFGYSKYSFSHLFNSYFGCTLTDYINALRARSAAEMLVSDTMLSMTEIAMQSGFESLRTFYRVFKQRYDCTPSAYRKRHAL